MSYMEEVFAPVERNSFLQVRRETFGHLAPEKNKTYRGVVIFAHSQYESGSKFLIASDFEEFDGSPWSYEALGELIESLQTEEGKVYRWDGSVRNYKFKGQMQEISVVSQPSVLEDEK